MSYGIESSSLGMLQTTIGLRTNADRESDGGRAGERAGHFQGRKNLATRFFGVGCPSGKILKTRSDPFLLGEELF